MKQRPRLLITLGDVAGIGPEVVAKAWVALQSICKPIVVGDVGWMQRGTKFTTHLLEVVPIDDLARARPSPQFIPVWQATPQPLDDVKPGKLNAAAGRAAYDFLTAAIDATLAGKADGIVTLPLNKEGLHAAGLRYPGHTEILAEKTGVKEFGMMLYAPAVRPLKNPIGVVHVTLHMRLRDVFASITTEAVQEKIRLLDGVMDRLRPSPSPSTGEERGGGEVQRRTSPPPLPSPARGERAIHSRPRLAVAALNPHASDGGIFGDEEARIITPAIEAARRDGINVVGPIPSDAIFVQARKGHFDGVVAMYHDQGHIALKLLAGLNAVNVTLGLPIVRTSVAHGTAYDIAGKGKAKPESLLEAALVAAALARS